jgi:hypothetical protein
MRRAIRVTNAVATGLVGLGAIAFLAVGSGSWMDTIAAIGLVAWVSALVLYVIAGTIWMALDPDP